MENGDEYVKTKPVPAWLARIVWSIIPTLAIVVVGNGLLGWRNDAIFERDLSELSRQFYEFKKIGGRCPKERCNDFERRLSTIETWRFGHTEWGRERVGRFDAIFAEHDRRLEILEQRAFIFNNQWMHEK